MHEALWSNEADELIDVELTLNKSVDIMGCVKQERKHIDSAEGLQRVDAN